MTPFIFIGTGILALAFVFGFLALRAMRVRAGHVPEFSSEDGGLYDAYVEIRKVWRTLVRISIFLKKITFQYIFHVLVRMLFYVKTTANKAYTFARNQFVRNAVKSKTSISFFWSHLKEYKKQIEGEREK